MASEPPTHDLATAAVWAGEAPASGGAATQVPIHQSVAFGYDDVASWLAAARGEADGHIYSRNTNPTVAAFESKVAALEGAEAATSFASGMAAVSNALFAHLRPGDRVVSVKDTYGGTNRIFTEFLPAFDIDVALLDTTDMDAIEAELAAGCSALYLETPTNPTLKLQDIARLADAAHAAGAWVIVDNTFATPINQQPLALGADLVLHSASKFLGGHADALGGVVAGDPDRIDRIFAFREINGAALDPFAAYLLLRGMKTLALRIERQNANALAVALWLERHPAIVEVHYPGLASHPQHELARRQMHGFGGMLSFEIAGGMDALEVFLPRLKLAHRAANLGPVETVVGPPATTSHVECTPEERAAMGIPEALVRYSTGIEAADDLIADLEQALEGLG